MWTQIFYWAQTNGPTICALIHFISSLHFESQCSVKWDRAYRYDVAHNHSISIDYPVISIIHCKLVCNWTKSISLSESAIYQWINRPITCHPSDQWYRSLIDQHHVWVFMVAKRNVTRSIVIYSCNKSTSFTCIVIKSINRSITHSIYFSIYLSINQSINQAFNNQSTIKECIVFVDRLTKCTKDC